MKVVFWGTYDLGKPRTRLLLRALAARGIATIPCHAGIWEGVEDKSQVAAWRARLHLLGRWLLAYPGLVRRYRRLPRHDAVMVGYPGLLDVLVLKPWARAPIVWDAFVPLYETVVEDRRLLGRRHPLAGLIRRTERLAGRLADRVLLDTRAHAEWFAAACDLPAAKAAVVLVGAEPDAFPAPSPDDRSPPPSSRPDPMRVLFYGQMIPLHGVTTIVEAARLASPRSVHWVLVGRGQDLPRLQRLLARSELENVEWIPWVPYSELGCWIRRADVGLGIFGDTPKAGRVIPNKVFQILAMGKPLITRDGPAIRELVGEAPGVFLVPPADPGALAAAVDRCRRELPQLVRTPLHQAVRRKIGPEALGVRLGAVLDEVVTGRTAPEES